MVMIPMQAIVLSNAVAKAHAGLDPEAVKLAKEFLGLGYQQTTTIVEMKTLVPLAVAIAATQAAKRELGN